MAGPARRQYAHTTPEPPSKKLKTSDHLSQTLAEATAELHSTARASIPTASTDYHDPDLRDCTSCEGRGKIGEKRIVKSHNFIHLGVTGRRREHEKIFWKKCRNCKGIGKVNQAVALQEVDGEVEEDHSNNEEHHTIEEEGIPDGLLAFKEEERGPMEKECSTCADEKPLAEYGYKFTDACSHQRDMCQDCVIRWVEAKVDEGQWNTITCPECTSLLEYTDISQLLGPTSEAFLLYDDLATQACLNAMGEYRHCLSLTCKAGQLHSGGEDNPIFICQSCGHKSCIVHNRDWHEGEVCADYDKRISQTTADNEASEAEVAKSAKACPKCKSLFIKKGGCDHMTCTRCRYEFCYLCLGDYADIRLKGNVFHRKECKYHTERL